MATAMQNLIFSTNEGTRVLSAPGVEIIFKATGEETGGAYLLMEYRAPTGFAGPAMHVHHERDEAFFILDGNVTFTVDGRDVEATAGAFVFVPRGTAHRFAIPPTGARFLTLFTPAGMEDFFVELVAAGHPPAPETVRALSMKYDTAPAVMTFGA